MRDRAQQQKIQELVGDTKGLPLRIAGEVAWKSIKVRLSRSLVTVSSVILAVAFLLVVLGGEICNSGVHKSWARDQQRMADVSVLYSVLEKPRKDRQLLHLLADESQSQGLLSWAKLQGAADLPDAGTQLQSLVKLGLWIEELKTTDRFKVLENEAPYNWLLHLDTEGRIAHLQERSQTFRGVRLQFSTEDLEAIAAELSNLRTTMTGLRTAERKRMDQVHAAGGPRAVMDAIRTGTASQDQLTSKGLPLEQVIPGMDADRFATVKRQLELDELRLQAIDVINRFNKSFSAGKRIELVAIFNGRLEKDPRLPVLMKDLTSQLDQTKVAEIGKKLAGGLALSKGAEENLRAQMQEVTDAFNKSFSGRRNIQLGKYMQGELEGDRRQPLLDAQMQERFGSDGIASLRNELIERNRLTTIHDSLLQAGFDPEDDGSKTFWLLVLSLMVCIVGIVNSMMMAVTERFREIATMKCLGALDSFILKAFLIESGSVGLVGSFFGAILGLIMVVLQAGYRYGGTFWGNVPALDLVLSAVIALGSGILLTIAGALLPAYKAARMHPIEAMRLEA